MNDSLLFTSESVGEVLRPIYAKTAAYGHFGRDEPEFSWEKTALAPRLAAEAGLRAH